VLIVLSLAGVARRRIARRRAAQTPATVDHFAAAEPPDALDFIDNLTAAKVATLLTGERPELVTVALARLAKEQTAAAALEVAGIDRHGLPVASRQPRPEVLASLAQALRAKCESGHTGPPHQAAPDTS
jgi:hypothetical protein